MFFKYFIPIGSLILKRLGADGRTAAEKGGEENNVWRKDVVADFKLDCSYLKVPDLESTAQITPVSWFSMHLKAKQRPQGCPSLSWLRNWKVFLSLTIKTSSRAQRAAQLAWKREERQAQASRAEKEEGACRISIKKSSGWIFGL